MRLAIPINRPRQEGDLRVSSHFGKAYAFAILNLEGDITVVDNPRNKLNLEHGAGKFIADLFTREGVELVLVKEIGRGALNHLNSKGIKVFPLPAEIKTVREALEFFKREEFQNSNKES